MEKIIFEDATLTSKAKVTIDGVDHEITPAEYSGGTDLNANTFNTMQNNIENAINRNSITTIELNDEWIYGAVVNGVGFMILIPINNPEKKPVTANITSVQVYNGVAGGWKELDFKNSLSPAKTFVYLVCEDGQGIASLIEGNSYLTKIIGTLTY